MMGCKKCKYAKWARTEKGNIRRSIAGECTYKVVPPVLPDSIPPWRQGVYTYETWGIRTDTGTNCPCFEAIGCS
jgi:hypothetical protein